MKKFIHRNRLAVLAVHQERIRVLVANGSPHTGQILSFSFDAAYGWDDPESLGLAFQAFLKQEAISSRSVERLALPADWVALRTVTLPTLEDKSVLPDLASTLAEEMFAHRIEDMAVGYDTAVTDEATHITIISLLRSRLEALQAFLRAAGLNTSAIFPYAALLVSAATLDEDGSHVVASRNGDDIEIAGVDGVRLTWLRTVENQTDMTIALRRTALTAMSKTSGNVIVVGSNELAGEIGRAFDCEPAICETPDDESLSLLANVDVRPTLNLLGTRKSSRLLRPILKRAALGTVLIMILFVWGFMEWRDVINRTKDAQEKISALQSDAQTAKELQDQLKISVPWRSDKAESLDALYDLTELFPQEATIWLRSFKRSDEGEIDIAGWAKSRQVVQHLLEGMEKSSHIKKVKSGPVRDSGKNKTLSFSVECVHAEGGAK